MVDIPPSLKDLYREGRLIPFVGAGVSSSVSWVDSDGPKRGISWSALVDQAAGELGFAEPDLLRVRGTALQILEYYRIRNSGNMAPLKLWFDRSMRAPDEALKSSRIHQALAALDRSPAYYTTNFDDFLERALELHGRPSRALVTESDIARSLSQLSDGQRFASVYKFHGDLANPDTMVLSESDYERRMSYLDVQDVNIRANLLGRAVLFIGYSFSDWNVTYLFRLFNETHGMLPNSRGGRRAYIAVADPSQFEMDLFDARNLEVIPLRGESREEDIVTLLTGLRS